VESVFVNIQVLSTTGSGYLSDYEADDSTNPGQTSVSFGTGLAESGSDVVTVAPPGTNNSGDILVTDNGSSTITLAIQVEGYFTDASQVNGPGDTYSSVNPTNLVTNVSIPAGTTSTFNLLSDAEADNLIGSQDAANVDAFQIEVGTINPSAYGYLNFIGGNTYCDDPGPDTGVYVNITSPLRQMVYQPDEKDRLTDIIQPELSSCSNSYTNGDIQIANEGADAVTIQVALYGYLVNSSTTDVIGSEYTPLPSGPDLICDTRVSGSGNCDNENGDSYSGALASDSSITVQETGFDSGVIPSTGVSEVADEIDAVNPTSTGWLTVTPYGTSPLSTVPVVNFSSSYNGADVSFQDTYTASTSSSGAITIYNDSPGTVEIVVSARGYWTGAGTPSEPNSLSSVYDYSSSSTELSWSAPDSDGGNPISSYNLLVNGTVVDSYGPATFSATVPTNPTDTVSLEAVNALGAGAPTTPIAADPMVQNSEEAESATTGTSSAVQSQVSISADEASSLPVIWTGSVVDPNGDPIAASITAYAVPIEDENAASTVIPLAEIPLASGTTGPGGEFELQASPTSALSGIETSDGTFMVLLYVSTSSFTSVYQEFMQVQLPQQINGNQVMVTDTPDPTGLTADGTDSASMAANWVQTSDIQGSGVTPLSSGGDITVPSGTASASTDVETNYPQMGPLPVGADTGYESAITVPVGGGGSGLQVGTEACGPWGTEVAQGKKWVSEYQFAAMPNSTWQWSGNESQGTSYVNTASMEIEDSTPLFSINAGNEEGASGSNSSTLTWGTFSTASGNKDSKGQVISALLYQMRLEYFQAKCYSAADASYLVQYADLFGYSGPQTFLGVWDNAGYSECFSQVSWNWGAFAGWGNGGKRWGNGQPAVIYGTGGAYDNERHYAAGEKTLTACGSSVGLTVDGGGGYLANQVGQTAWSQNDVSASIGPNAISIGLSFGPLSIGGSFTLDLTGTDTNSSTSQQNHEFWMKNTYSSTDRSAQVCPTVGKWVNSNDVSQGTFFSGGDGDFVGNVSSQD
jgi:hypothetical protein